MALVVAVAGVSRVGINAMVRSLRRGRGLPPAESAIPFPLWESQVCPPERAGGEICCHA